MKKLNACCSFCEKSYRDVGPLVEGPGDVYICGECAELVQEIIKQERRRRSVGQPPTSFTAADIQKRLDSLVVGEDEATRALALIATHRERHFRKDPDSEQVESCQVLLIGPSRSSQIFLSRALAHFLEAPFVGGSKRDLLNRQGGAEEAFPLIYALLKTCDWDIEKAQHGIVYVDGVDHLEVQEVLLRIWDRGFTEVPGRLRVDVRNMVFVCGGAFADLNECAARLGRHPEQPITREVLTSFGMLPNFVEQLGAIARMPPLHESTLVRAMSCLDFSRLEKIDS
jgi:ATP-dependent Clp protease ATP-binding subunit ClpX